MQYKMVVTTSSEISATPKCSYCDGAEYVNLEISTSIVVTLCVKCFESCHLCQQEYDYDYILDDKYYAICRSCFLQSNLDISQFRSCECVAHGCQIRNCSCWNSWG